MKNIFIDSRLRGNDNVIPDLIGDPIKPNKDIGSNKGGA